MSGRATSGGDAPRLSPFNSPLQNRAAQARVYERPPAVCVVTGGTGFVGQRLVEMLVERGAERVVSFDIVPPNDNFWRHPAIEYVTGDISDKEAVDRVCQGADCVWHNAAAVGPFHPQHLYMRINYEGTLNVIEACRKHGVPKVVMSSSPSTRFTGEDIDGLREDQMPQIPMRKYLQDYAASKAAGEKALRDACCDSMMTVAVAPHQVYGPRDNLFMPNLMEAAGTGKLRVFAKSGTGYGMNKVCYTHVDNYAHGLIIAERALYPGSPALGQFYIVTDGDTHTYPEGYCYFWQELDKTAMQLGFPSMWDKYKLPYWLLMGVAYVCNVIGWALNVKLKLNPFNIVLLTMHRWFNIDNAIRDLHFQPIIGFTEGWQEMGEWFKTNWLPAFQESRRAKGGKGGMLSSIATQSQRKIDIQNGQEATDTGGKYFVDESTKTK